MALFAGVDSSMRSSQIVVHDAPRHDGAGVRPRPAYRSRPLRRSSRLRFAGIDIGATSIDAARGGFDHERPDQLALDHPPGVRD